MKKVSYLAVTMTLLFGSAVADEYVDLILNDKMHLYRSSTDPSPAGEVLRKDFVSNLRVFEKRDGRIRVLIDEEESDFWIDPDEVRVTESMSGAIREPDNRTHGQRGVKYRLY